MIEARLAFRSFEAALDGPSRADHAHDDFHSGTPPRKDHRGRQVRRIADAMSYQQAAAPGGLQLIGQRQPMPVIPASTLGAIASTQPYPARGWQRSQDRLDLPFPIPQPEVCFARNSQHTGLGLGFQPYVQAPIVTVEAATCDPQRGYAGRRRSRQCALGQLKLGRKTPSQGDPSPSTARAIVGPGLHFVPHRAGLPSGYAVAYAAGHRRVISSPASANATDLCIPPEGGMHPN
jgi:hypothetical protein